MSINIEQAVREVAKFLATDPTHVTGQDTHNARNIVAIVERNLTPRTPDSPKAGVLSLTSRTCRRLKLVRVYEESEVEEVSVGEYRLKPAAANAIRR